MEKRTLLVLFITVAVLFFFQMYFGQKPQQGPAPKKQTESTQETETPKKEIPPRPGPGTTDSGPPPVAAKASTQKVSVETPLFNISLQDLGGGITSVRLKQYKEKVNGKEGKEIIENTKPYTYLPIIYQIIRGGTSQDSVHFKPDRQSVSVKEKSETIVFTGTLPDGRTIKKSYTFHPDTYTIDMRIEQPGNTNDISTMEFAVISSKQDSSYVFKGPFYYNGKKLEQIDKLKETIDLGTNYRYAGFDDGFFAFIWIPKENNIPSGRFIQGENSIPVLQLAVKQPGLSGSLFFGPKQTQVLKSLNIQAEKIIDFGWFDIIAKPLIMLLNIMNRFTHNYGIDIIILTIIIKIIFYPLTVKSYKSMKEMQKLQPQIAKIKEKYKDNKERLNKEMMDLYRTRKINPMGGCLPMVIQIPVFFALYKALSGAIELRHASFFLWINDLSAPEDLYTMHVFGFALPIRILPLIMGITQLIQQKMTPTTADPMQEKIMLFMPIFFTFLFWGFPSGLVLYWLVNNVISIAQQYYINKKAN